MENILTGKHIYLELINESHREKLRALSLDTSVSTYMPAVRLKFDAWFDKALKNDMNAKQLSFVVCLTDNQIVGTTRFYEIYSEHKRLAIGYTWYIPAVWGTKVNPECKLLLLQYAFDKLQMNRIEFFVDSRNKHSCAAVKKLGATQEGVLRQHLVLEDGYLRDTVVFSILKKDWPNILSSLQERII